MSARSYKYDGIPMDPLITTAARALAAGDPLGALKRVALRDDAPPQLLAREPRAVAQLGPPICGCTRPPKPQSVRR